MYFNIYIIKKIDFDKNEEFKKDMRYKISYKLVQFINLSQWKVMVDTIGSEECTSKTVNKGDNSTVII